MAADPPRDPDPAAPDRRAVRRHFARAAATYDGAAVLQKEIGGRMAERLDVVKLAPAAILDAGCGTGDAQAEFAARYPARAVRRAGRRAADARRGAGEGRRAPLGARAGLRDVHRRTRGGALPRFVCGDVAAMPFARGDVRPRLEQPGAAMGERPAARRSTRSTACSPSAAS